MTAPTSPSVRPGGVALTYDLGWDGWADVEPGDLLLTPAGSAYLVLTARRVRRRVETAVRRFAVRCERLQTREAVDRALQQGAGTYPLHWYARSRR